MMKTNLYIFFVFVLISKGVSSYVKQSQIQQIESIQKLNLEDYWIEKPWSRWNGQMINYKYDRKAIVESIIRKSSDNLQLKIMEITYPIGKYEYDININNSNYSVESIPFYSSESLQKFKATLTNPITGEIYTYERK